MEKENENTEQPNNLPVRFLVFWDENDQYYFRANSNFIDEYIEKTMGWRFVFEYKTEEEAIACQNHLNGIDPLKFPNDSPFPTDNDNRYLILSGEGDSHTENQFLMECSTLEEANMRFDEFKKGTFKHTYLYIYKAVKLREG